MGLQDLHLKLKVSPHNFLGVFCLFLSITYIVSLAFYLGVLAQSDNFDYWDFEFCLIFFLGYKKHSYANVTKMNVKALLFSVTNLFTEWSRHSG